MPEQRHTFPSDRPDGRFVDIEGFLHEYLKNLQPALGFDPHMPREHFAGWRARVADKLRELLALPRPAQQQPAPTMLAAEPREGYELQKWECYPEPYSVVPYLVLVPEGFDAENPGPAVLCFPGSNGTKEALAGEPDIVPWAAERRHPARNMMGLHYARAGITAAIVDHPDRGEHTSNMFAGSREELSKHAIWAGRSFESISVGAKLAVLDWLKTQSFVDPQRIAVSGHSLGAKPALHLGVLDPSLAAVVWNDFFSHWLVRELMVPAFRGHLGHYIPGMQQWFDYTDLAAAVAPRPFLITEGGRSEDIDRVRRAWDTTGAPGNFSVTYYPKYATPEQRPHDDDPLFEGMTLEEYFEYANVDAPAHCFKENVAVPWLARVLRG